LAEHNEIGKQGELLAQKHLVELGYAIIKTNWRKHRCEVDIIAYHNSFLCFIEVKSRTSLTSGDPRDAVNKKKQQELIKAANYYLEDIDTDPEVRFDIVEVILKAGEKPKFNLIEDAFNAVG
jgi:putative endonuclease